MTREDVVQAALTVERWCVEHYDGVESCDCPFYDEDNYGKCNFWMNPTPAWWRLERFLRTRGLKHDN